MAVIYEVLQKLLLGKAAENDKKTLVFTLGEEARKNIGNIGEDGQITMSLKMIENNRKNVHILFLNRLQYLFMYLMKLEADKDKFQYDNLILYGLDSLIAQYNTEDNAEDLNVEQIRLSNLIFNSIFKIKRKYEIDMLEFIPIDEGAQISLGLLKIEKYWKYVC
ncbi:hypothetical protein KAFR_0A01780 [Kazachstania africana CBS 2517]|uniref:Uncharacterized protein n=1 Tax=Kazachstania africana (strain ATCC 22294 / BCRC 22015 / CBS 2517 / CECT 1963 / NBRC 1671 / NRRL Y-8276) TaxID=1071382 RepID=H2AML6_KAZAF|nr:hypothetical protein KAFR_0A01780 [Kazachstania africana CBS 2517]CCF55616.1 hypothetical protein KAFR_0A01780 [Kazachstania africana CBS 2517]